MACMRMHVSLHSEGSAFLRSGEEKNAALNNHQNACVCMQAMAIRATDKTSYKVGEWVHTLTYRKKTSTRAKMATPSLS